MVPNKVYTNRLRRCRCKLNAKKTISDDDVTQWVTALKKINGFPSKFIHWFEENQWFGNENRINSGNFNITALKLTEKFYHPFLRLLVLQYYSFDAVTVKSSKYYVSIKLDREKFKQNFRIALYHRFTFIEEFYS